MKASVSSVGTAEKSLHPVIIRSTAPFWGDPRNDLVRVHDVASLAMHAIGEINMDLRIHHLVNRRRAEMLARIAKLLRTTMVTNIRIAYHQMYWLIVLVTRPRVVDIRKL